MQTYPQFLEARIPSARSTQADQRVETRPAFGSRGKFPAWMRVNAPLAALLLAISTGAGCPLPAQALQTPPASPQPLSAAPDSLPAQDAKPAKATRNSDRRKAAKLYLSSSRLYASGQFEEAMREYEQAATLDPGNADYPLATSVARSHAVTALIQAAAKDRMRGDNAAARAALTHALELEPGNMQVNQHLFELGDDALREQQRPLYEQVAGTAGNATELVTASGSYSFHLRADQRQIIQMVFKTYGVQVTIDDSVRATPIRLDVDNVGFEEAARILGLITTSFYIPLDAHRVLVARDTRENRLQFTSMDFETVYLSGLNKDQLTEVVNLAKNVFDIQQATAEPSSGTITIRAPVKSMKAFNSTMSELLDGRNQVMLEVRMIQLAHTSTRNTGVQPPQSITAFNVYAQEQSILNANQSLVQQIVSSGLASPNDPLAILLILAASGQITNSLLTNGFALFGGGLTQSALSTGPATLNLNLNSSDSRELDDMQLRLGDGEAATLRTGTRYPIQTSTFTSIAGNVPNIPGLTGAGSSSNLSSLLASYGGSMPNIPQVEYQDLGLTLKATPKVLRNDNVALTIDLKIDALSGASINGNPILNNRAWSGVVTVEKGEAVEVISELDKSESRAISGTPGISEIPGLNNLTGNDIQKNFATLLIIITPHVIRGTQAAGHSPMMRVDGALSAR
jgi:Flp pilus assembly secretin CpaC